MRINKKLVVKPVIKKVEIPVPLPNFYRHGYIDGEKLMHWIAGSILMVWLAGFTMFFSVLAWRYLF